MWYKLAVLYILATQLVYEVTGYINCDFESSVTPMCSFYQDSTDNLDWKHDSATTQTSATRPIADHTYANKSGHYVFIEASFPTQGSGKIARLLSPTLYVSAGRNQSFCVKFFYHMYGPQSQNLHMFIRVHDQAVPQYSHWNKTGNLGDVWHAHSMNLTLTGGVQILFEATQGSNFHGAISLDDIKVTEGTCPPANTSVVSPTRPSVPSGPVLTEFECDFEYSNLCDFAHDTRNAFDWKWRRNTGQPSKGPLGDHTTGSSGGSYLFVSNDPANQQQEQRSRVISPLLARNSGLKCLHFFYFMNGNNMGQLNAYAQQDNLTLPLQPAWSFNKSLGNLWQPGFVDILPQQANYKVVFEVIRKNNVDAIIAIDDLKLNDDICPEVNASTDFESGLGGFIQDTTDDMNWVMKRGRTPSYYTGPNKDHTYGNSSGHFVYVEASYPARPGHIARLLSPVLLATTDYPRCLTFWYHMFGEDIEALNVYIINGTQSDKHDLLWTRAGNRGNRWRAAEVHLQSSINFQVVFEAEQGSGYRGDIALDDIEIVSDVCPGEHHFHNYSSITCDFEEPEICYYEQDQKDDIDWSWINSDSGSYWIQTGPEEDHTLNNELGFYMFVTYANTRGSWWWYSEPNQKARLLSPYASPQKRPSCLEFWYHMYGRDTESIKVYIQKEGEDIPDTPTWEKSGDQENFWHRATTDVDIINKRFRFIFQATTGHTYQDDIAIDDVTFYNNSACPPFVTEPPPPIPLPPSRSNASCNFEDIYVCNYTQEVRDNADWSRRQGNRWLRNYWWWRRRYSGPKFDHTRGNDQGSYMNFDCDWWIRFDFRAQIATPYLSPHQTRRCLQFYYYMYGYGVDFLHIYLRPFGYTLTVDPQMSIYGYKGDQWNRGTFDLPPSLDPYRVIFEASRGWYWACDIAIDDIVILEGACPSAKTTSLPPTSGNCDFESADDPLCGYEQDTSYAVNKYGYHYEKDDFDWRLHSGNTSSVRTGPIADHTLGTAEGHYMYIESSLPRRPKEDARLISPLIEGSKEKMCVQFYTHMRGSGVGNLAVFWQSGISDAKRIWMLIGEQEDGWKAQTIELEPFHNQFQLVFEASVGRITYGDIAIDDITILRQPCQGHLKESACGFDVAGDWCGYTQSNQDDQDWKWYDINNAQGTPPIDDVGDMSYVYLTSSQKFTKEKIATLVSRAIDGRSSQHCLEFDYFLLQNVSSCKLTIAIQRNDGNQVNIITLTSDVEEGGWKHLVKTLNKRDVGERFQVVFIGVLGDNLGAIGLDNPTVSLDPCEEQGKQSYSQGQGSATSTVSIFFAVLSTLLLLVLIAFAGFYLYRKYKDGLPNFSIRYDVHKDDDNMNEKKSAPKALTIENPLYASDPAIVSSGVTINDSVINGASLG